ncbi:MAG: BlaI/MecI/CopY family transcriptional regulator [Bacteroidetes bacterium]|nr:MAG: BlaI/MecI/CopY family transcriptional regulator [Bacteroidota bacterium]
MKELTRLEEQLMQLVWQMEEAFVRDIIDAMPEPKPANSTVSTMLRILVSKGFLETETRGKSHLYRPLIQKDEYMRFAAKGLLKSYFNGSVAGLVSFFAKQENLKESELEEIARIIQNKGK